MTATPAGVARNIKRETVPNGGAKRNEPEKRGMSQKKRKEKQGAKKKYDVDLFPGNSLYVMP